MLGYGDYTSFSEESFLTDLLNSIKNILYYEAFENKPVPRKTKLLRGNHKHYISKKKLRKEIKKRSQLKGTANNTGKDTDLL